MQMDICTINSEQRQFARAKKHKDLDVNCHSEATWRVLNRRMEMDGRGLLPDAATYNTLVKHLCGIGRLEEAESLVVEMQRRGCVPSARTFGYFLKAAKSGSEAAAVVSRMKRARCELDGDTWNQILNLYVRWDDQSGVAEVWSEMEKRGLGPDQRSYTVLIHGLHGRGRLEEASRAYVEMKSKGMIPEPRTNLLMRAIELVKKNGPGPDKEKPMSSRPTGPS
ncbi:putative pentatricopeptide repeat-containing protein At3g15200 [Wolffia australiana]